MYRRMDGLEEHACKYVKATYVKQGLQSLKSRQNELRLLLSSGKLPQEGWNDSTIEFVLHEFSTMDSNNFYSNVGLGEREGRGETLIWKIE